jgi:regulator of nonsense transcripts 1
MDTFDNFQYESASSYGGALSVVDDNSSVYTANTQSHSTLDLESLSVSDYSLSAAASTNGHAGHQHIHNQGRAAVDEDYDAVLDDLKDEGAVVLPPHACRFGVNFVLPLRSLNNNC